MWRDLITFASGMKYASLMRNAGLLMALGVALFVGCKREKEQNGPSLTVAGEPGVLQGDLTLQAPADTLLRLKLIAQKGSGKDDADLKDYSFSIKRGSLTSTIYANRPAPNGQSFTIDTIVVIEESSPVTLTLTFTVTDKNGKSASRSFTITVRGTGGPVTIVDTFYNQSYTNQNDNKGTHLRYQVGTGTFTLQNRTQANSNAAEILFVYWYSSGLNKHSVISPGILDRSGYQGSDPYWTNPSRQTTNFREVPSNVTSANFASLGYQQIIDAYNNGTPIDNEFTDNADQRAECTAGRILAFKQGNIYGLIRVDSVTSNAAGARLSVKIARP